MKTNKIVNAIFLILSILTIATNASADIRRKKNTATYITFEIYNSSTGALISSATGLDCERSGFDDGTSPPTFTDVSGTETEIRATGTYYVALNTTDTNFDYIYVQCKSSSSNAVTWTNLIDTIHGTVLTNSSGALSTDTIPGAAFTADGTLQAATSTTAQLASAETYANSEPNGRELCIVSGTGKGQCREITAYVGSTDTATVAAWTTTPDNTSKYVLGGFVSATVSGTVNANVTQWSGTNVGTPDTNGYPKVTIKDGTGAGEIDTKSGAVVAVTTGATCSALGATAKSDVNAEVVDVIRTDTVSELSACPTASATLNDKVTYLYQYFRHKLTSSSSAMTLYKDDGSTTLCSDAISDSGSLFTRGEMN